MGPLSTGPTVAQTVCNRRCMDIAEVEQIACGANLKVGNHVDVLVQEVLIGKDKLIAPCTPSDGVSAQTRCDRIITIAAIDDVTALTACNSVGAQTCCDRIVTCAGDNRIVTVAAGYGVIAFARIDAVIA